VNLLQSSLVNRSLLDPPINLAFQHVQYLADPKVRVALCTTDPSVIHSVVVVEIEEVVVVVVVVVAGVNDSRRENFLHRKRLATLFFS